MMRRRSQHLYESRIDGKPVLVCSFFHPAAHGHQRWGDRVDAPYLQNTVVPTLMAAVRARSSWAHPESQPGDHTSEER